MHQGRLSADVIPACDTGTSTAARLDVEALDGARYGPRARGGAPLAAGGPDDLTPLNLHLLGFLVEGVTQVGQLAAALGADERTVADALRTTLAAWRARDLTAAAVPALRTGCASRPG